MNMVITFVLHPLSHYNSITKPRARFLLSLLKHLTIDFPYHFILSIIDVHLDSISRDKLILGHSPQTLTTRIVRKLYPRDPKHIRNKLRCDRNARTSNASEEKRY